MTILITLAALAYLASGYAVNAGFVGLITSVFPEFPIGTVRGDYAMLVANTLFPPCIIVVFMGWHEYGRQPFRWDWPRLLIREK